MEKILPKNIKFLRKQKSINQTELGLQLNKTHKIVSNWETEFSEPSYENIIEIGKFFGISIDDLLTKDLANTKILHKSQEIESDTNTKKNTKIITKILHENIVSEPVVQYGNSMMPKVVTMDTQGNENVVFVPVKARAGYLNGYGDEEFISTLPAYRLPGLNTGTFRIFEVGGLSMHPTLFGGDMVIGTFVETLADIRDDRVYVVVTQSEGVVVKRCLNRIKKDGKLILKSDNYKHRNDYPDIICNPEDVLEVWYVTANLTHQLRPPSEMYTRLIDLEARLILTEEKIKKQSL